MSNPSQILIQALRKAAEKISFTNDYQWGHMGACNCGFLAQVITNQSKAEIHNKAMQGLGDWNEQLNDYCAGSKLPFDQVIEEILNLGLLREELMHLENLSDSRVLNRLPKGVFLKRNVKDDVIIYLHLWADLIEENLASKNTSTNREFAKSLVNVK